MRCWPVFPVPYGDDPGKTVRTFQSARSSLLMRNTTAVGVATTLWRGDECPDKTFCRTMLRAASSLPYGIHISAGNFTPHFWGKQAKSLFADTWLRSPLKE